MERLEKVRILEKDFPAGIPKDIGSKPLEVINDKGETVALFYNIAFMKRFPKDLKEFIKYHDGIFYLMEDFIDTLDPSSAEETEEELVKRREFEQELGKGSDYIWSQFYNFIPGQEVVSLPILCRWTYPYYLEDDVDMGEYWHYDEPISEIELVLELADFNVYRMYFEIHEPYSKCFDIHKYRLGYPPIDPGFDMVIEHFPEWIYEHPDFWFNLLMPEYIIDEVTRSGNVELIAFLLDYKNKHFPYDEKAKLEIDDIPEDEMRRIFRKAA